MARAFLESSGQGERLGRRDSGTDYGGRRERMIMRAR